MAFGAMAFPVVSTRTTYYIFRCFYCNRNIRYWCRYKRKESGKTIYYHKGGTPGFVSFAGFNLEDQIGVVVLSNGRRYFSDLGFKILDPTYPLIKAD